MLDVAGERILAIRCGAVALAPRAAPPSSCCPATRSRRQGAPMGTHSRSRRGSPEAACAARATGLHEGGFPPPEKA